MTDTLTESEAASWQAALANEGKPVFWPAAAVASVAKAHGLTVETLRSGSRKRKVCEARWEAMALLRARGWSLTKIGDYLGKDHTTVLYGLRRAAGRPAKEVCRTKYYQRAAA